MIHKYKIHKKKKKKPIGSKVHLLMVRFCQYYVKFIHSSHALRINVYLRKK